MFQVSILDNIVHLIFGIAMARTRSTSKNYLLCGGAIYLGLWIYTLLIDRDTAANFVPVNNAGNWLHLILGTWMVALAQFLNRSRTGTRGTKNRHAEGGHTMTTREKLGPMMLDEIRVQPSGRSLYLVHYAEAGRDLGTIRVCDDRRLEAVIHQGHFAGVHKTVAEAVDYLSLAAEIHQQPPREYATRPRGSTATGRHRPIRRGVYAGLLARRNTTP